MPAGGVDLARLKTWIGRQDADEDRVSARRARQMAGLLGWVTAPGPGDALPEPWHWLLFQPVPHAGATGTDGHQVTGGFLPPVPLPRRMWAAGHVRYHAAPVVGERVRRVSQVADVTTKQGRSGLLVLITVAHAIFDARGAKLADETQQLVYRDAPDGPYRPSDAPLHEVPAEWSDSITPDVLMLFRYSALTYNGHRIHYDRGYATQTEGYPGLVVHAPLTVSVLLDAIRRHVAVESFTEFCFRAVLPLFDGEAVLLKGRREGAEVSAWALNASGQLAMSLDARSDQRRARADP